MKKLLLSAALLATALIAPARATQIIFYSEYSFATPSVTNPFTLELGTFASGFTPTALNTDDWLANWITDVTSPGYLDTTTPEWSASLTFADNSLFATGSQLYLWAYDVRTPAGAGQWALFTQGTADWLVPVGDPLALSPVFLEFTASSRAIVGQLNYDLVSAASASSTAISPVPEPSTYGLIAATGLLVAVVAHRRRRRSA